MLGSVGAMVMVSVTNSGVGGLLSGGVFLLSSLGFVGVNGWRQRSQAEAGVLASRREYLAYLDETRTSVRNAAKGQRRAALWNYPNPGALSCIAEERTRVWERSATDPDFLAVRLGLGDQDLCITLEEPEVGPLAQLDPVAASAAHRFLVTHRTQHDLPMAVRLGKYATIELAGPPDEARSAARSIVSQLATFHSPDLLHVVVLANDEAMPEWEWVKWLPHAGSALATDGVGPSRLIAPMLSEILDFLPPDLADRPRFSPSGPLTLPHLLVVVDGGHYPADNPLITPDGTQGITVLSLPESWGDLTGPETLRVLLGADGPDYPLAATAISTDKGNNALIADRLSVVEAEAVARRLAPLYTQAGSSTTTADQSVASAELVDLLGIGDIRDTDLSVTWQPRPARDRLRVPIGITPEGQPVVLDVKESAHGGMGPHGLIIGATGSGKSEVLRTLVLSLALTHSSEALNFVLVDFKGGATFAGMSGMPHVSAIITNLGEELSLVDRMQDALQGEMVRRQELLRAAGNFANVTDYEKARLGGRTDLAPLPSLLIVCDEFSELIAAKPEFVETFVAIGRLGRSLQVHLLLASQRLEEGKLKGLDSHLSYRIGLRTFSESESRTVLGVPDAYHLPPVAGVGYLKPDTTTMIRFRASYVSGPPKARRRRAAGRDGHGHVGIVPFTAAPVLVQQPIETSPEPVDEVEMTADDRATFDIGVDLMRGRGPQAHAVWLPPLEIPSTLDELMGDLAPDEQLGFISRRWREAGGMALPLGITDLPAEQRREVLSVDLSGAGGNMAIVGAPRSGKSTAARMVAAALSLTRTPAEVQIYVLDFGGGTFTPFSTFPHVAGVASRSEPDVVRRAIAEITSILNQREEYFRANGIDSIETYLTRRAAGLVDDGYGDVFLIVDGWATVREDFDALEPTITAIAARGLTFGVHLVLTASRWMELRPALRDMIATRLELRLGDPSDSDVNRRSAVNVPANAPGRGLNPDGKHMLIGLPRIDADSAVATLADGVESLRATLTQHWKGAPGPKLRLLPDMVTLDQVRSQAAPDDPRVLLGLEESQLAPFGIDPKVEPHLFLFGDSDSGKSAMLRAFAHEVTRLYEPSEAKIFVVDLRRSLLGQIPAPYLVHYASTHELATGAMSDLAGFFRSRLPGPDVTAEQLRNRSWWAGAEGFILVDDYDLVATSQGNPLAPLVPLLSQASDVGMHLVVTRRSGGASRASYDPILQSLTDLGTTGILLSGNPEDGPLIGRVKAKVSVPGRAQVVSREHGLVVTQLAWAPPEE